MCSCLVAFDIKHFQIPANNIIVGPTGLDGAWQVHYNGMQGEHVLEL